MDIKTHYFDSVYPKDCAPSLRSFVPTIIHHFSCISSPSKNKLNSREKKNAWRTKNKAQKLPFEVLLWYSLLAKIIPAFRGKGLHFRAPKRIINSSSSSNQHVHLWCWCWNALPLFPHCQADFHSWSCHMWARSHWTSSYRLWQKWHLSQSIVYMMCQKLKLKVEVTQQLYSCVLWGVGDVWGEATFCVWVGLSEEHDPVCA